MQSHVSTLRSISYVLVACALSCADDSARIGASGVANPPRAAAPPAPSVAPDAAPPEPPSIDLGGRVVDDLEQGIVGRSITVVDGRGKRQEILTDEEGGFHLLGVLPPYDLLVAPAPSGPVILPVVFLGLRRADPRLEVFEGGGTLVRPKSQPIRVGVKLPPCRATSGACWVSVATGSPTGGGAMAGSYTEGTETAAYEVDHSWRAPTTRPGEEIEVHVMVGDAQYTQYSYARIAHVAARPGEPTELGMTMPLPIESGPPITVAGRAHLQADGWQWTMASELDLSGGATIALRYDWASASSLRLPQVPGATWRVGAWAQHPPVPERPYFSRSAQTWSGSLPVTATDVVLALPVAPEPIRPVMDSTLSRRGAGFAWDGSGTGLASLVVGDLVHAQERFRAYTAEAEIPLRRLEALGLARLLPGEHVLDLTTTPGANVDELTQPDERLRTHRFDTHVPGATTYQRFRFVVTP